MISTTESPICHCPNCLRELDRLSSLEGETPAPGDITVCLYCSHILILDEELKVRELTDKEMLDVAGDPDVKRIIEFTAAFRRFK